MSGICIKKELLFPLELAGLHLVEDDHNHDECGDVSQRRVVSCLGGLCHQHQGETDNNRLDHHADHQPVN